MELDIFVPATIGNVGPGFDCFGLAVSGLGDRVVVKSSDKNRLRVEGRDAASIPHQLEKNAVYIAMQSLARSQKTDLPPVDILIDRRLPSSGGLGSSAASSVAGALAAAHLLGCSKDEKAVFDAAIEGENAVSGYHLDNLAPCLWGGLVLVLDAERKLVHKVATSSKFFIGLVSPQIKLETKGSRGLLPTSLPTASWVKQLAHSSGVLVGFIEGNINLLRANLNDPFAEPVRATKIPGFDAARKAAIHAGAAAFLISGGGPSCFLITEDEDSCSAACEAAAAAFGGETSWHVGRIAQEGALVK